MMQMPMQIRISELESERESEMAALVDKHASEKEALEDQVEMLEGKCFAFEYAKGWEE